MVRTIAVVNFLNHVLTSGSFFRSFNSQNAELNCLSSTHSFSFCLLLHSFHNNPVLFIIPSFHIISLFHMIPFYQDSLVNNNSRLKYNPFNLFLEQDRNCSLRAQPLVFLFSRNNGYAISTPTSDQYRGDGIGRNLNTC